MRQVLAALVELCDRTARPDEAARWRAELGALAPASNPTAPATVPLGAPVTQPSR
jgi:hypothetical protein